MRDKRLLLALHWPPPPHKETEVAQKRHHPGSKAARDRVSDKISKLISSGEAKNRDQAVAIAHSMEKRGELGPRGGKKS